MRQTRVKTSNSSNDVSHTHKINSESIVNCETFILCLHTLREFLICHFSWRRNIFPEECSKCSAIFLIFTFVIHCHCFGPVSKINTNSCCCEKQLLYNNVGWSLVPWFMRWSIWRTFSSGCLFYSLFNVLQWLEGDLYWFDYFRLTLEDCFACSLCFSLQDCVNKSRFARSPWSTPAATASDLGHTVCGANSWWETTFL